MTERALAWILNIQVSLALSWLGFYLARKFFGHRIGRISATESEEFRRTIGPESRWR